MGLFPPWYQPVLVCVDRPPYALCVLPIPTESQRQGQRPKDQNKNDNSREHLRNDLSRAHLGGGAGAGAS